MIVFPVLIPAISVEIPPPPTHTQNPKFLRKHPTQTKTLKHASNLLHRYVILPRT